MYSTWVYPPFVITVGVNYCKHNREYNGIYQIHHTKIKWIEKLFFEGSPVISVSTCTALSCKSMFCTFGILGTVNIIYIYIYIRQYIQHSHSFARNQRFIYPIVQSHPATRHSWAVTSYPFSPWCRLRFDQRYFAPRCHIGFLWQKWVLGPLEWLAHLIYSRMVAIASNKLHSTKVSAKGQDNEIMKIPFSKHSESYRINSYL